MVATAPRLAGFAAVLEPRLAADDRRFSALGLCAEIGQFDRFEHPDQLACYLGIVPSENTSGERWMAMKVR